MAPFFLKHSLKRGMFFQKLPVASPPFTPGADKIAAFSAISIYKLINFEIFSLFLKKILGRFGGLGYNDAMECVDIQIWRKTF